MYFTRVYTAAVRTPTRVIPNGNTETAFQEHKGAIIGGAVGGAALIIALATGCICFMGRQRKKRRVESRSELLAQQSPQELYAPIHNPSGFQHNMPSSLYQQSPIQLPAERNQSPIELGGHEISSTTDPYGSATTEKSTFSYPHPSPSSNPSSVQPSGQSPYGYPSHSRQGSLPGSPGAIPLQGPPPGNQTYYPSPEEFNSPTAAARAPLITPTTPFSNRSQAYSHSPAGQQYYPPPQ